MFKIADREFKSRLFIGTGKYPSAEVLKDCISESETEMVTVSIRRMDFSNNNQYDPLSAIPEHVQLLPNTSGAIDAKEAIFLAELAREATGTSFIKLEVTPNQYTLLPDPIETLKACEVLVSKGFKVLPYMNADPMLAKRLESAGASAVMPLGSLIGSNNGLKAEEMIKIIISEANVPVIVDAGLGRPSDAAKAMEIGATAVLLNTAIASSPDPTLMAGAFKHGVIAGRDAYLAGIAKKSPNANPSSLLTGFLSELQ